MDRLAIAQYLSRIGLLLEDDGLALLAEAKQRWLDEPAWQGVRRYVEDSLVLRDWFELSLAQNLVSDGLVYPLLFEHFDAQLVAAGAGQLGMLTEFMRLWFAESQRWVDALVKTAVAESPHNRQLIEGWVSQWRGRAVQALLPLAEAGPGRDALDACDSAFGARLKKLGLSGDAA